MSDSAEPGQGPQPTDSLGADHGTHAAKRDEGVSPGPGRYHVGEVGFHDYQALASASADMNTVATAEGRYVYVSSASKRLFGWDPVEVTGHMQDEFIHPDDLPSQHAAVTSTASGDTFTTTHRFRCADGSYRWAEATSRRVGAWGSLFVVSTVREITERQKADERVQRLALTDPLTGLANRTVLMDRLRQALRHEILFQIGANLGLA